jgi:peptidoglycan-N-acetylglucosamine deacetylase
MKRINKRLLIIILLSIICSQSIFSQNRKQVAITIDDLPALSHGLIDFQNQEAYFGRILETLSKYNISVTGFAVGHLITRQNSNLIRNFLKSGHSIGNHTFSHTDLNKMSAKDFILDIEKNQKLLQAYQPEIKYFRYPMLHRGNTVKKHDSVYNYLKNNGYTIVPVTIDTDEADYNIAFVKSFFGNTKSNADSIGNAYINHMIAKSLEYEKRGYEIAGRGINHILLIHMNFINSFYLDYLVSWYKNNGWEIVSLEAALTDPIYNMKDIYIGQKGVSWLERIAVE